VHRSNRYLNQKLTKSTIFQEQHSNLDSTYLYSTPCQYNQILPAHSAAGVHVHSCGLYQTSTYTTVEPLSIYQHPWLGLTDASRLLSSQTHYIRDPKIHPKNWPITIEPRSIYTFPWSVDHGQADSLLLILHYFGRTTLWLDFLQFALRALHIVFTIHFTQKFRALSRKTVMRSRRYPTLILWA